MTERFRADSSRSSAVYLIAAFLITLALNACTAKPTDISPTEQSFVTVSPTSLLSSTPMYLPPDDSYPSATLPAPTEGSMIFPTGTPNQLGNVNIYRDGLAGFALDYPAGWHIRKDALQGASGSVAYMVSLYSWDHTSATPSKDLNTLPDGTTKIDITVFNKGSETLAEAVHQMRTQDSGTSVTFTKEENWVLGNGQEAVYLESDGALGVVGTMITLVNGRTIYVSGYGNLTLFKEIALSLHTE